MNWMINNKYSIAIEKSKLGYGFLLKVYPFWIYIFTKIKYIEFNIGIFKLQLHFSIGTNEDVFE